MVVVKPGEVTVVAGWVKATVTVFVAEHAPAVKIRRIGITDNALIKPVFMRFTSFKSNIDRDTMGSRTIYFCIITSFSFRIFFANKITIR